MPGDGCDELCQVEAGYSCGSAGVSSPSLCGPICGDGLIRAPEQCDDGNLGKGVAWRSTGLKQAFSAAKTLSTPTFQRVSTGKYHEIADVPSEIGVLDGF